jgi:dihydroneopterin aldolase
MIEITLERIRVDAIIGVYEFEKEATQPLFVTVSMTLEHDTSAQTDDLKDTCDYDQVIACIDDVVNLKPFELIEAFGKAVKDRVEALENVDSATVLVEKPNAVPRAEMTKVKIS